MTRDHADRGAMSPSPIDPRPSTIAHSNGIRLAVVNFMKAKNLEDVVVYNEALAAEDAVSALLQRPGFSTDLNLKSQLDRSSSRVAPLIAEGFGQLTDRHVATYLARARGSAAETRVHLRKATRQKFISPQEHDALCGKYITIGKRLSRWIHHLQESDWRTRG